MSLERIEIDYEDWPQCARCKMCVEEFYVELTDDSTIFVAVCHNDKQIVEIPNDLWNNAELSSVGLNYAFRDEDIQIKTNGE